MPYYLPLCASRQALLPAACRSCAWWQTAGNVPDDTTAAGDMRRQWMTTLEATWGSTGLLLATDSAERSAHQTGNPTTGSDQAGSGRSVIASINYAPAASVPRFRELPFSSLPADAVLLFCLKFDGDQSRASSKRLLHKALDQLRSRGVQEVYAVAIDAPQSHTDGRCEFFSLQFVEANGFVRVGDDGYRFLVRTELRNLVSVITQVQTALRRVWNRDPTPSPAAWTRRSH